MFIYRIQWVHLTVNYFAYNFNLFFLTKLSMLIIPTPLHYYSSNIRFFLLGLSQMNFKIKSLTSFLYFSCTPSFHQVACQINMSVLMMHVHTCFTDNTIYTMLYVRSVFLISWWMYTHVLLITLFKPSCMADHYARINDECTPMFYW